MATPAARATRSRAADRSARLGASAVVGAGDRDQELIGGVGRGVYVVDFWYTRILDPRTCVTGLTRNGVWLIEDGKLGPAVRNLRFTQSFSEALAPGGPVGRGGARAPAQRLQTSSS